MMSDEEWAQFEATLGKNRHREDETLPLHDRRPTGHISRKKIWEAQEGLCALCGHPMGLAMRSIDHVVPKSRGGVDRVGNALIAHFPCNQAKGDRLPTGCELIWLMAVNSRLGVDPMKW